MEKVYQVFVSSTFNDLKDERLQVSNTLAKAGYVAAGMELFPATDQQQLEYIERVIDRSDYYVVILGARYGSLSDDGKSFTEKEFEYARSKGIPVLAFLHENPRTLAVAKTDEDPHKAALLEAFRTKLQTGRIVEFWRDASDLCTKVLIAVANAVNLKPGVGWVRGDQAIDPKVLQETERLRIENAELRERLNVSTELTFDPNLLGPADSIDFTLRSGGNTAQNISVPLGDLFVGAYDAILAGTADPGMSFSLGLVAAVSAKVYVKGIHFRIDHPDVVRLRNQFEALGLVLPLSRRDADGDFVVSWSPTEKGRKFAASRKAIKKENPP